MQKLIRLILGERRRDSAREPARRVAQLFNGQTHLGEARILDESESGFRIAPASGAGRVPDAFTLLAVDAAVAHEVEVAWRSDAEVGVHVVSEQRLRGFVPPQYQPLKAFWERAAVLNA